MREPSKQMMNQITAMLENDSLTDHDRDLLGQSLFYYGSGKDPSPIIALGAKIPLYVYADSFAFTKNDFVKEAEELYQRLQKNGFCLTEKLSLICQNRLQDAENAELTLWESTSGDCFALLFVQDDAIDAFTNLYEESENYIQPRYVCNYRYELSYLGILKTVEKRAEYILGHCFDPKYRCIAEFDYHGDYGSDCKMKLYRRFFYYLY